MRMSPPGLFILSIVGIALMTVSSLNGQPLVGFGPITGQNDFFAFDIDPVTGAFAPIASIGPTFIACLKPAYDPVGRRLFVLESLQPVSLVTLELDSGAVTVRGTLTVDGFLEYSNITRKVYEVGNIGPGLNEVESIGPGPYDAQTVTPLQGFFPESTALDDLGQRLFILGSTQFAPTLYIVRLATGEISTAPAVAVGPSFQLLWDWRGEKLYGVGGLLGETGGSLFQIDPGTGVFTRLAQLSSEKIVTAVFDPDRKRVYFTNFAGTLTTYDLATARSSTVTIERCCPALFVNSFAALSTPMLSGPALLALVVALGVIGTRLATRMG